MEPRETSIGVRHRPKVPINQRKRSSRACKVCRDRKSKCIATDSVACFRCQRKKIVCVYESACQDGSRTPEQDPALIPQQDHTAPATSFFSPQNTNIRMENALSPAGQFSSLKSLAYSQPSPLASRYGLDEAGIPDLVVENFSPSMPKHDNETSSHGNFLTRVREAMFMNEAGGVDQTRNGIPTVRCLTDTSESVSLDLSDLRDIREATACFPPKEVAEFLASTFFDYAVDSFFYFHKPWFARGFIQFYNNKRSRQEPDVRFITIALLVFAVGSQFAHFKKCPGNRGAGTSDIQQNPGLIFYRSARRLFPDIMAKYSLEAVQVSFLMAIFELPSSARSLAYYSLGLALKIAVANEFHRKIVPNDTNREALEIRNRLWWSVYALERTISIKMGRPESIRIEEIDAPLPEPLISLDSNLPNNNLQQQIAYAKLTLLLSRVCHQTPATLISQNPHAADTLEALKRELKQWRMDLPEALQLQNLDAKLIGFRSIVHLHQNYHHTWIMMCRSSLLALVRDRLKTSFTNLPVESTKDPRLERMAHICAKAARKMIRLFETLRENDYLARFSFTDFHGCSIATIILLLHGILERDATYDSTIKFAFESLEFMATDNETARLGVRFVKSFQSIADEAVQRMKTRSRRDDSSEEIQKEARGYESWLQWLEKSKEPAIEQQELSEVLQLQSIEEESHLAEMADQPYLHTLSGTQGGFTAVTELQTGFEDSTMPGTQLHGYYVSEMDFSTLCNHEDSFLLGFTGLDVLNNMPMYDS